MKKVFGVMILFFLILVGCAKFEINNSINPEVMVIGGRVGIKYNLGDIVVNDELDDLDTDIFKHIYKNRDNLILDLKVELNETQSDAVFFNYYLNGVLIETNKNVISKDVILLHRDSIKGFVYYGDPAALPKEKIKTENNTLEKTEVISEPVEPEQTINPTPENVDSFKKL